MIQARIWAKRFPGKVLADLGGETVLQHLIRRCKQIRGVSDIYVATPDLALVPLIQRYGATAFLGAEENVLSRYVNCAKTNVLDGIVRLTADCPFIDPGVVSDLVTLWKSTAVDYASNVIERSYPYGLDAEVVSVNALQRIQKNTNEKRYREHVTLYIREHLDQFTTINLRYPEDWTYYDWRLDTPEDLPVLKALYKCSANALRPFPEMLKSYRILRYGEHLRVSPRTGRGPERNTATHVVSSNSANDPANQSGCAWYERGHSSSTPGPESA